MKFLKKINTLELVLRILDVFLSLIFILLFSPFLVLISLAVKLTDFKSPVCAENHWRVGRDGKLFLMYKFRTMVPNAHELLHSNAEFAELRKKYMENGAKLKIKDDVRITLVGKIIRRFDLDELPQLFNVLKGDMSLVGPRAYFKQEIDLYSKEYPSFKKKVNSVLKLKPGITGLWQISGRNLLTIPQRIGYDYEYFKKKSIIFYILILLKTPIVVITRYGAYE